MIHLALLLLSTVVPGQLQETFPFGNGVPCIFFDAGVGVGVSQEVQVKATTGVFTGSEQFHAKNFLVELQTRFGRLDSKHRVIEPVTGWVCGRSLILIIATDDFHPVAIGILDKSNISHPTLGEFLLEGVASVLESLAGDLNVVNGDGDVPEASIGFGVAVDDAIIGVVLSAIVVGEFQDAVAVRPVTVALERRRTVVGKEVKGELVFREVQLADLA